MPHAPAIPIPWWQRLLFWVVVPPLVILAATVFPAWVPFYFAWTAFLYIAIWTIWLSRGKRILFILSDSPVWKPYIETEILPTIQSQSTILNWSERKRWPRLSLTVTVFNHFRGRRDFNPMAIVFRRFQRAEVFRFYRPFQDHKHGRVACLDEVTRRFLRSANDR